MNFFSEELKDQFSDFIRGIIREEMEECIAQMREEVEKKDNEFEDDMLTRFELRDRWRVSLGSVHNYVKEGRITPTRIGRRVLFKLSDVLKAEAEGLGL